MPRCERAQDRCREQPPWQASQALQGGGYRCWLPITPQHPLQDMAPPDMNRREHAHG
jgi:hypothetical protein